MNDIRQDASARYTAIDIQHQPIFLSRLAHRFTVVDREAHGDRDGVTDSGNLKSINEVRHRISGQQLKMLMGDGRRYLEGVFVNILVDCLQALKITPENVLQWN